MCVHFNVRLSWKTMSSGEQNYSSAPTGLRTAYEVQEEFAKASVLHSEIVWDVIGPHQSDVLIRKLESMFPHVTLDCTSKEARRKVYKQNANMEQLKRNLFRNIWEQRKFTNGVLLHSIIYVMVTPDINMEQAKISNNYTIHPVFRTRRCLNDTYSAGCCMIFIDEKSRVYQNWNDFVNNNELPYGIMIAPKDGCYTLDEQCKVDLECSFTPAFTYQALNVTDKVVSATSVVAQAITLFNPAFSILTIGAKTYETIRNYQKMSDKVSKETATKCRANVNLTTDLICLTSTVASFGAHVATSAGKEPSFGIELSLQAVNGAAALIHCTKLIKTTYDLFTIYFVDGEKLDFSDFLAFSTSLVLFTNSINNIGLTSQIGKFDGNTMRIFLQSKIRTGLSFILAETIKHGNQKSGNLDLLRLANDISYREIFCNIRKIYNNLTCSGFLTTLSVFGHAVLEIVPGLYFQVFDKEITKIDMEELRKIYGAKFVKRIADCRNLIDVLNGIGMYFPLNVLQLLFDQTCTFFEAKISDVQQSPFITTEMVLYKMFSFIIENYKVYTNEFLSKKKDEILLNIVNVCASSNPGISDKKSKKYDCNICEGIYYLTDL